MARTSDGPRYYASKRMFVANHRGEKIILLRDVSDTPKTRREAKERYKVVMGVREVEVAGDSSPVFAIFDAYLKDAKTRTIPAPVAPSTYDNHKATIDDLLAFQYSPGKLVFDMPYRELTMKTLNAWLNARKQEKGWGETYCTMRLKELRTAATWAANEGGLVSESFFARGGKRNRLPESDLSIKRLAISNEEAAVFIQLAGRRSRGNFAELLELLHHTGARPAELYKVTVDEWQPEISAFVIDPKDKKNVGRLKTRKSLIKRGRKRIIYIPSRFVPMIDKLISNARDGRLFYSESGEPWEGLTKKKLITNTFRKMAKRAVRKELPVRPGLTLYSFRHGFITRWLKSGRSPMDLCELLNTSLRMLQDHYWHLFDDKPRLLSLVNTLADEAGN